MTNISINNWSFVSKCGISILAYQTFSFESKNFKHLIFFKYIGFAVSWSSRKQSHESLELRLRDTFPGTQSFVTSDPLVRLVALCTGHQESTKFTPNASWLFLNTLRIPTDQHPSSHGDLLALQFRSANEFWLWEERVWVTWYRAASRADRVWSKLRLYHLCATSVFLSVKCRCEGERSLNASPRKLDLWLGPGPQKVPILPAPPQLHSQLSEAKKLHCLPPTKQRAVG